MGDGWSGARVLQAWMAVGGWMGGCSGHGWVLWDGWVLGGWIDGSVLGIWMSSMGWMGDELMGESWGEMGVRVVVWVSGMGEWMDGCWGVDGWVSGGEGGG